MNSKGFPVQYVTLGVSKGAQAKLNKKYFKIKKADLPVLMLGTFHRDDYPPNRFADPNDEGWMEKYIYYKSI